MDKLTLIFSDIEAGGGTATDDLVEEDLLIDTIRRLFDDVKKQPTDLVLNGDIFDLAKCPYKGGTYPRHITPKVALWKLELIAKAHSNLFQVWKDFLDIDKRSRIVFITGNHDFELAFPEIQQRLRELIAGKSKRLQRRILFPGFEFTDGLFHVEHGSQLDNFFAVDPDKFVHQQENYKIGEPFLLVPWGFNALYDYYIHVKEDMPILERLLPKNKVFQMLPNKVRRQLVVGSTLYMLKAFFYTQFRHWDDVLYRFMWEDFYKYFSHFFKREFDLQIVYSAKKKLRKSPFNVLAIGHNHQSGLIKVGEKYIINTGPWRDEYKFTWRGGARFLPKDKSYGYLLHTPDEIKEVKLVTVPTKQKAITRKMLKKMLS